MIKSACRWMAVWLVLAACMFGPEADDEKVDEIVVGSFTKADKKLPQHWKHRRFDPDKVPRPSRYEQVKRDGDVVLRADTRGGASLLYRRVKVDWRKYPYLAWRWRVDQVFEKEDERDKGGDDYPARVYVGFKYDPDRVNWWTRRAFEWARSRSEDNSYPPLYTLTYVWATEEPVGAVWANPYQDRAKMIVVRSGEEGLKEWHSEVRNYVKDCRRIIGENPTQVEFVAIMIDGDNTKSRGVSYFDDIRFLAEKPKQKPEPEPK